MSQAARIISLHTADTSGVCSMLYELGGMTVVHDASGCNSTYATHDEPRWPQLRSRIFISALTETDAILGNDEKLVSDTVNAAAALHPRFIALCGSPMPMMTGTDFDALSREIEERSGVPTIPLHTNGMHSYLPGAAEALLAVTERFAPAAKTREPQRVNILGLTPLDFGNRGVLPALREWLRSNGFTPGVTAAMDCTLEDICDLPRAGINLVVSTCALATAQYLEREFGQPYIVGVPYGQRFAQELAELLRAGITANALPARNSQAADTVVIGEAVTAASLARALELETGISAIPAVTVECPAELQPITGCRPNSEAEIAAAVAGASRIIADPLYRPICGADATFCPWPSVSFSGRCYLEEIPILVNQPLSEIFPC